MKSLTLAPEPVSVQLRIVELVTKHFGYSAPEGTIPGDMWRVPEADADDRECWAIVLPNGNVWRTTDRADGPVDLSEPWSSGWDVTGDAPRITVRPSINDTTPGREWHGWITSGHLIPC